MAKKETVDNHGATIATDGTGHVARTKGAVDRCKTPQGGQVSVDNEQPTTELKTGRPTKTFIKDHYVWTKAGLLDKSLSRKPHLGTAGGVKDPPAYLLWASAKTCSKDLIIEKFGVVRTDDETFQNRKNCEGFVDGKNAHAAEDDLDDQLKKRCTIKEIKGKCKHTGEGTEAVTKAPNAIVGAMGSAVGGYVQSKGMQKAKGAAAKAGEPREFGPAPGQTGKEPTYLGVFSGDELKLEVTRVDATKPDQVPAKKAECSLESDGKAHHTHWLAVTTGSMFWVPDRDPDLTDLQDHVGDKWTLTLPGGKKSTTLGAVGKDETKSSGPGGAAANAAREGSVQPYDGPKGKGAMALEVSMDLAKAYQIWRLQHSPPTCVITARACAGAKALKCEIYPEDAFEFNLFSDTLKNKLAFIKGVCSSVEWVSKNIGSAGGLHVGFHLEFLQKPNLTFKIQYKELTEDKNGFTKQQVKQSWSLNFSFEPFLLVGVGIGLPLTKVLGALANGLAPGASLAFDVLERGLAKFNIRADFVLEVEIELKPEVALAVDEYNQVSFMKNAEAKLILRFKVGFEIHAEKFTATGKAFMENTIALNGWKRSKDEDKLFEFNVRGYVQFGMEGSVVADVLKWFLDKPLSKAFRWAPPSLRFPEGEGALLGTYFCPMPTSGKTVQADPPIGKPGAQYA